MLEAISLLLKFKHAADRAEPLLLLFDTAAKKVDIIFPSARFADVWVYSYNEHFLFLKVEDKYHLGRITIVPAIVNQLKSLSDRAMEIASIDSEKFWSILTEKINSALKEKKEDILKELYKIHARDLILQGVEKEEAVEKAREIAIEKYNMLLKNLRRGDREKIIQDLLFLREILKIDILNMGDGKIELAKPLLLDTIVSIIPSTADVAHIQSTLELWAMGRIKEIAGLRSFYEKPPTTWWQWLLIIGGLLLAIMIIIFTVGPALANWAAKAGVIKI